MSEPRPPTGLLEIRLTGQLTAGQLDAALAPLAEVLSASSATHCLLVDCREMTGYDADARARFVEWNRAHRRQIRRIAIITSNRLWHMVISTMSLAARQKMRPFVEPLAARTWLEPPT